MRARTLAGLLAAPAAASASVSAFSDGSGFLAVNSTDGDAITVACIGGDVKANGSDPFTGRAACRSITSIVVNGDAKANAIDLSRVSPADFAATARVRVRAGGGDDVVVGSELADEVNGDDGEDRLSGFRNAAGGRDLVRGNAGNDTLVWNDGDGSDTLEGDAGKDTIEVNGSGLGDAFTVAAGAGGRVAFNRLNLLPFSLDIGTSERLDVNAGGDNDTLNADGGTGGIAPLEIDAEGGDGNDVLTGGDGADTLDGGPGADRLTGFRNPGGTRDMVRGGDGDDTLVWDNGDGSDTLDGQGGEDRVEVDGSKVEGDEVAIRPSATPRRVDVDRTNLVPFNLDIGTSEAVTINGNGGDDVLRGSEGLDGRITTTLDGGDGADRLQGSDAPDVLRGGGGTDLIRADDRAADDVQCGGGLAVAIVDRRDGARGCEIVEGGAQRVRAATRSASVLGGAALIPLRCVGTRRCGGTVTLVRAGRTVGSGRFAITGRRVAAARVELTRRGRSLATRGATVSLRIDARDGRGNGWPHHHQGPPQRLTARAARVERVPGY